MKAKIDWSSGENGLNGAELKVTSESGHELVFIVKEDDNGICHVVVDCMDEDGNRSYNNIGQVSYDEGFSTDKPLIDFTVE